MFKKILIPTDGSALATQAALEGIDYAKRVGAEVICVYVAGENQATTLDVYKRQMHGVGSGVPHTFCSPFYSRPLFWFWPFSTPRKKKPSCFHSCPLWPRCV